MRSPTTGPATDLPPRGRATVVITEQIRPGHEEAFQEWQTGVNAEVAAFAGFEGTEVLAPTGNGGPWTILYRFDTVDELEAWLASPRSGEPAQRRRRALRGPDVATGARQPGRGRAGHRGDLASSGTRAREGVRGLDREAARGRAHANRASGVRTCTSRCPAFRTTGRPSTASTPRSTSTPGWTPLRAAALLKEGKRFKRLRGAAGREPLRELVLVRGRRRGRGRAVAVEVPPCRSWSACTRRRAAVAGDQHAVARGPALGDIADRQRRLVHHPHLGCDAARHAGPEVVARPAPGAETRRVDRLGAIVSIAFLTFAAFFFWLITTQIWTLP